MRVTGSGRRNWAGAFGIPIWVAPQASGERGAGHDRTDKVTADRSECAMALAIAQDFYEWQRGSDIGYRHKRVGIQVIDKSFEQGIGWRSGVGGCEAPAFCVPCLSEGCLTSRGHRRRRGVRSDFRLRR